ncbi:unnamed protein product [Phytophthora fragariaefolia]|uniref:Unnamed protein product n=1 Tax=Phytophthora fragariaefolia TaxID=1490495 RepID=A0A9W7D307_9STRA|nr:unnamed protein product [Phytophthora fragariaefolia]
MAVPITSGGHQIPMREVANALSDSGSDEDEEKERDTAEPFRRSSRVRHPNLKYIDFDVDLPAMFGHCGSECFDGAADGAGGVECARYRQVDRSVGEGVERSHAEQHVVERSKGKKALSSKGVFKRKRVANGNVARHRSRITVKGCQQKYGVDFWKTYSPVIALEAVKFILLVALHIGLSARHMDFVYEWPDR